MKIKLTAKEYPFITLGRLKSAIQYGTKKRQLEILEKVERDMSEMDIKMMHLERNQA